MSYLIRNASCSPSDEMNEASVSERGLKGVFKLKGKLYDVYLDENEIVWTLQGELSSGILVSILKSVAYLESVARLFVTLVS